MKIKVILLFFAVVVFCGCQKSEPVASFVDFEVNPKMTKIEMFWKDGEKPFKSLGELKKYVESKGKKLGFAMNGGIYQERNIPLGLYVEDGEKKTKLNVKQGEGNFYLQPNGVFYLTKNQEAFVKRTQEFSENDEIQFATQSGPMLLIDGKINPLFSATSENVNIRNGVCVNKEKVVFSISKEKVTLYDFAKHFQDLGCENALYLDGFVSRMYFPEKGKVDLDGDFGAIIVVTD